MTQNASNQGETVDYAYDIWKRNTKQTIAGRAYTFGFDNYDRKQSLKNENTNTVSYPNGLKQETKRDAFDELISNNHYNNSTVANWTENFGYDDFGNITSNERAILNQTPTSYNYSFDSLNRIQQEFLPDTTKTYSYDIRGNRETVDDVNMTSISGNKDYTYNALNQLVTFNNNVDMQASYTYYSDGQRATKTLNGQLTRYIYADGRVIEELDASGNVKARNIWGNDLIFRKDTVANKAGYYFYNGHGDVVKITDGSGNVLNAYDYDIWGNVLSQSETMSNPFKYTGEIQDSESGLIYLSARYYDPAIGRFITEDTYEGETNDPLTLNLYVYTGNNPIIHEDPTGHWFLDAVFLAVDVVQFVKHPSIKNFAWIAADVLSFADPTGAASTAAHAFKAVKAANTLVKETKAVKRTAEATSSGFRLKLDLQLFGKGKNNLKPDPIATGDHTVLKRNPITKEVTNYQTYKANPQNPSGFDKVLRYDGTGTGHINKITKQNVPTPHVNGKSIPGGVRPAQKNEIPRKR